MNLSTAQMIPKNIHQNITEGALKGYMDFLDNYTHNEKEIISALSNFRGIKSEYYCRNINELNQISKFLAIFSDFTSVFTYPNRVASHFKPAADIVFDKAKVFDFNKIIPDSEFTSQVFDDKTMHFYIPDKIFEKFSNEKFYVSPGYMIKTHEDLKEIINIAKPFFDSGSFLLRPVRILMVLRKGIHEIFFAKSDTAINDWQVKDVNENKSFVIDNSLQTFQSDSLLKLTLPFFKDISLATLSKVLQDEQDTISQFRNALFSIVKNFSTNQQEIKEVNNDIIRPQIEELSRKFKTISSLHKLSVVGTVSTFTLSLIAVTANSSTNFQTLFGTMMGTSSIGLLATEIRFQQEQDKLRDKPLFLLWKISQSNHR